MADPKNESMEAFLAAESVQEPESSETATPGPEETVEEAVSEVPAAAPEQEQPASSTVPHQALHEERERRKRVEQELQQNREKMDLMNQRFAEFTQFVNQGQPAAPAPNADEDPIAAIKTLTERVQGLDQLASQYRQQSEIQERIQQVNQAIQASHQQHQTTHPDHLQAMAHLRETHMKMGVAQGFTQNDALVQANRAMQEAAVAAIAHNQDPATVLYTQAQALGYAAPQQEAPAPPASLEESAAKLAMLQEGQKAAVSPSQGGAQPANQSPQSLEDLAELGDRALDDEVWRRFMGGQTRLDQMFRGS